MQLKQIIVRPSENKWLIQYTDIVGRLNNLALDSGGVSAVAALITEAQSRLPAPEEHPDITEVQQEIEELEYRLQQLKASIGQP